MTYPLYFQGGLFLKDFDYPGVYGLYVDGKVLYVGSSKNIRKRLRQHFTQLKSGKHKKELQDAYDIGKEIVPICLEQFGEKGILRDLLSCEKEWIDKLNPPCNSADPFGQDPLKTICWLNYMARERRYGTHHNKYEYYRRYDESKESEMYDAILGVIDRYYSFFEADNKYPFGKIASIKYLVVRTDYDTGKSVEKAAEKARESLPHYIMKAVRERMERES